MDPAEKDGESPSGRFRRLVSLVLLILRAFSNKKLAMHSTWNDSTFLPANTSNRRKHKPDLQQLTQPGAMQAFNSLIHQRLLVQPTAVTTSFVDPTVEIHLTERVQRTLTDSSWTRNSRDLEPVCEELQSYEAFKDYPPHIQKLLCKVGWFQKVEPGRIIYRQGQQPSAFYLILTGSVRVLVKTRAYDEVVQMLKAGQSFGGTEITKRQLRGSTCVANSTAQLLVISKSDYIDLSLRQSCLSFQRAKHFAFCKTVSVLKYFPLDDLENRPEYCSVKYFKPNAVVVKDSKNCDYVCVIMTGSCRVVKRFINSNDFGRSPYLGEQQKTDKLPKVSESGLVTGGHHPRLKPGGFSTKSLRDQVARASSFEDPADSQVKRHALKQSHTVSNLRQPVNASYHHPRKHFLVQLQILHPKDTFGLSSLIYTSEPSITLVSNGADIVMLSKEFLMGCMSEVLKVKLQRKVMQYPSEEAIQKRIRDHNTWKSFKHSMVHQLKSRQVH